MARGKRGWTRSWPNWLRIAVKTLIVLLLLPYILTLIYAVVPPVSTLMLWRWVTFQRVERDWTPIAEISPALRLAVIVAEDGRFCTHRGIDLHEIQASIEDAESLDELRGSSTITQQVAKNLFLWNSRSFVRKALEVPISLWMSVVMTKTRVLEIYLNIAEWGPDGEFGAEAAAQRAFGRSAGQVSPGQAALLAASLPNPHKRNAKSPGPGLRRLAGTYVARAQSAPEADDCLGLERRRTP